jgi:hypothetical protein
MLGLALRARVYPRMVAGDQPDCTYKEVTSVRRSKLVIAMVAAIVAIFASALGLRWRMRGMSMRAMSMYPWLATLGL